MTREEAIGVLECMAIDLVGAMADMRETNPMLDVVRQRVDAINIAQSALRPVSREQVEQVWRGVWVHTHSSDNFWTEVWKCSHCDFEDNYGECFDFCPFCGAAQTDEAVDMVMERLEVLKDAES